MTILEALQWGEERLKAASQKTTTLKAPKLEAQTMLAHAIQKNTSYLIAHLPDSINTAQQDLYIGYINRRAQCEPMAYILGSKEFYKRRFLVTPDVLIPRPETELIIDFVREFAHPDSLLIDIGTGSGAIAVTAAAELQQPVIAIDDSAQALSVAKYNARKHGVEKYVSFLEGDLLTPYLEKRINSAQTSSAILCANLPYLTIAQWQTLDPDAKIYEPKHALVGGVDGLDYYETLLTQVVNHRSLFPKNTVLLCEIDPRQAFGITALAQRIAGAKVYIQKDLSGRDRLAILTL